MSERSHAAGTQIRKPRILHGLNVAHRRSRYVDGVFDGLTAQFAEAMSGNAALQLDQAMWLIAAHQRPGLESDAVTNRLDELASRCSAPTLDAVVRQLFQFEGFTGNRDNYYDPDNSLIDQVLERRTGIPISLSVVTIEVGRRLRVPMDPVGMPGHFLLRDRVLPDLFVDPFHGGAQLTGEQCRRLFTSLHGPQAAWSDKFLDPLEKPAVVFRVLNNLRAIFASQGDIERSIWTLRLLSRIPGASVDITSRLVNLLETRARYDEAADELDLLVAAVPSLAEQTNARAQALRSRLN